MAQFNPYEIGCRGGAAILKDSLPDLLIREGYRTTSSAWHSDYYIGSMATWNFTEHARNWNFESRVNDEPLPINAKSALWRNGCVDRENYLYGDEQSVCGRYGQNALAPVGAVASDNGIPYCFGDYKACYESQQPGNKNDIPDFVAAYCRTTDVERLKSLPKTVEKPSMVLVGEAKTPWNHNLPRFWKEYTEDNEDHNLRHAFGQIASYMHHFKMRYGFLTTYNHTIFLHQGMSSGNVPMLYFTPPIHNRDAPGSPGNGVSVRQCFYLLLAMIEHNKSHKFENPLHKDAWTSSDTSRFSADGPHTPNTHAPNLPAGLCQMTPEGMKPLATSAPLTLIDHGFEFRATISFPKEQVHAWGSDHGLVHINGKPINVVVSRDGHSDGPKSSRGGTAQGIGYPVSQRGEERSGNRAVTFGTSHGDGPREAPSKGTKGIFDSLRSRKEPSHPKEPMNYGTPSSLRQGGRIGTISPSSQGGRRGTPSPPTHESRKTSSRPDSEHSSSELSQELSPYRGAATSRVSPDMFSQSPTPAPVLGRGRGGTTLPYRSNSPPYSGSSYPQHSGFPIQSARRPSEQAGRNPAHRPRDREEESQPSRSESSEGRKLRSSNKTSGKPSRKK
ncbi:hypothetical protein FQN49_003418 [Arthroderma sp. PD_2]|nr:hypothetical protein FQN49_003418 [Arthroderma sp. PD_2]